tara:strand:- start:4683 stop:5282 length:600 start_codon:yes stop_codon:yes gene_type:complete
MSNLENVNLIEQLFQQFIDNGGEPKVTSFKRHLDQLINADIKPLCGRSGKTATGDDWRSEVKSRFSGRGAKWVSVSLEEIAPTLETYGHDVVEYRNWIDKAGYAWIRFTGPRVANGVKSAAFEVRTGGSTIDHPKQLHYIALHELDDKISQLAATPHAMRLEERATTPVVEEEIEVKEEIFDDAMGDIEALMAMEDEEL